MQKPPTERPENADPESKLKHEFEPWPLDFVLLEKLPEKGLIGGIHWRGRQVRDLRDEINDVEGAETTSDQVSARLRALKIAGYTQDFPGAHGRIWARLQAGSSFLRRKESYLA